MHGIWADFKYSARMLGKNPGFAVTAVFILAAGIGINTLVFSVIDALFLRSSPAQDSKKLVLIDSKKQNKFNSFTYPEYLEISRSKNLSGVLAVSSKIAELEKDGEKEIVSAEWVSENYFSVLGVKPAMGLAFEEGGKRNPGEDPQVIISYGLWQSRFGADPDIIGKSITVNRRKAVVRGVAAASFVGLKRPFIVEIWVPFSARETIEYIRIDRLLGRLSPDAKVESVRAELKIISHQLAAAYPATNQGVSYSVDSLEEIYFDSFQRAAAILSGPFLFLMICCANIAGMGLAKAEARRHEVAVRLALGSGGRRVLRQLITENFLLSLAGMALGWIFTAWLIRLPSILMPPISIGFRFDLRLDWRVLLFTLAITAVASFISGLIPALHAFKSGLSTMLKSKLGATEGRKHKLGLRSVLVAGQVAASLALLVATGLFVKSLFLSMQINPGFDPDKNILIVNVAPFMNPQESSRNFFQPVLDKIKSVPGVKNAAYAKRMLLSGSGGGATCEVSIPGAENPNGQKGHVIKFNSVAIDYFETVGAAIRKGRAFDKSDEFPNQRTVIISEKMAEQFWPKSDALGSFIVRDGINYQVVGIAQNGSINNLHEKPEPYIYFFFGQIPMGEASIMIQTNGNPADFAAAVRGKILSQDKSTLIISTDTLEQLMDMALYTERMTALATSFVGALGLIISAVGLYGIVLYLARDRFVCAEDLCLNPEPSSFAAKLDEMNLEEAESFLVKKALAKYDGNISQAAEALGLSRGALYRRLQKFGENR